jgi:Flp pilus assembly protein TadG
MKTRSLLIERKGSAAVEFAIVLPVLLLFVFGIVEWGLYMFNRHVITDASREGARNGIVAADPRVTVDKITQVVDDYSNDYLVTFADSKPSPVVNVSLDNAGTVTSNTGCPAGAAFGQYLAVEVRYDYTFLLLPALTGGIIPPVKTIVARTNMTCE